MDRFVEAHPFLSCIMIFSVYLFGSLGLAKVMMFMNERHCGERHNARERKGVKTHTLLQKEE